MGNREFLRKSVTTAQQTLSMTQMQLFNNVGNEFLVRLKLQEGVEYGVVKVRLDSS